MQSTTSETLSQTATGTLLPNVNLPPEQWQTWPVIPTTISPRMVEVYQKGLEMGNDPNHFSKAGDCHNVNPFFLYHFDFPGKYRLGAQYEELSQTIDYFLGSWSRQSLAVAGGMNIASALAPIWADLQFCQANESPVACEIRVHKPSLIIISFEVWGNKPIEDYDRYLRLVVEYALSQGVVPILATKADQLEGDFSINLNVAQVAYDYDLPLWNFWAAVQHLPDKGLSADKFHITCYDSFFDDPVAMQYACPWRNLTALQTLDFLRRSLNP